MFQELKTLAVANFPYENEDIARLAGFLIYSRLFL
jgi:hypothetical protein